MSANDAVPDVAGGGRGDLRHGDQREHPRAAELDFDERADLIERVRDHAEVDNAPVHQRRA